MYPQATIEALLSSRAPDAAGLPRDEADRTLRIHARLAAAALGAPLGVARVGCGDHEPVGAHGAGTGDAWDPPLLWSRVHREVCAGGAPVREDDGSAAPGAPATVAGVPLRGPGGAVGSLCVLSLHPRRWTDAEMEVLREIADAAAEQLELLCEAAGRARDVERRAQRMADRMRAVASAASGVLRARSLRQFHEVLRDATRRVLAFDAFTLAVYDADAHALHFLGSHDQEFFEAGDLVPVRGTPSERVIRERSPLLTLRSDDPASWGAALFGNSRRSESTIRAPVLDGEEVLGVVSVQSYTPDLYTDGDVEVLEAVAALAATAIRNVQYLSGREAALAALQKAEERHRALFEQVPTGVFFYDHELRVTAFNERFLAMTQLPREQLLGYRIRELPDARVLPTFEPVLRGEAASYEGPYRTPTGVEMWLLIRVAPLRDSGGRVMGGVGVLEDHTAHRGAELERAVLLQREQDARADAEMAARRARFLAEASEMFTASLDPAATLETVSALLVPRMADSCLVYLLDPEGGVHRLAAVHADPGRQEAIRARIQRYTPILECILPPVAHALRTGESRFVTADEAGGWEENPRCRDRQGDLDPASLLVVPLMARGRILGALSLGYESARGPDPEDRALVEEVARRAALALDNAQLHGEVQKALQTRKRVMQAVSHDLRNPLTSIMLNSTSLLNARLVPALGQPVREALGTISFAAEQMERLIQDLLDVTRLEAGHFAIDRAPQHLPLLVGSGLSLLQPIAERQGVELTFSVSGDVPLLPVDGGRILQVLSNLVENAIKFTPAGREVRVAVEAGEDGARVSVTDAGPGIQEAHRTHLFTPFWQGLPSGRRSAGLGLTIARGIVEAHGGRIGMEDAPGGGSVFHFTLPYGSADEAPPPRAAGPAPAPLPAPARAAAASPRRSAAPGRPTVLVVDDSDSPRTALAYVLERAGYGVVEAADGEQGVREARRCAPGLVLMDLNMPVMDGWAATRRIRDEGLGAGGRVPVVAVTAQILSPLEHAEAEILFDDLLPKPVTAARLLETVERLLSDRGTEAG